mmetsp:Transcript_23831/g.48254  ORF Transcript_23831/g.48254 Transcript_23831/m.48254 type:complete len:319 (-) Transcript_23831:647-1603(-)
MFLFFILSCLVSKEKGGSHFLLLWSTWHLLAIPESLVPLVRRLHLERPGRQFRLLGQFHLLSAHEHNAILTNLNTRSAILVITPAAAPRHLPQRLVEIGSIPAQHPICPHLQGSGLAGRDEVEDAALAHPATGGEDAAGPDGIRPGGLQAIHCITDQRGNIGNPENFGQGRAPRCLFNLRQAPALRCHLRFTLTLFLCRLRLILRVFFLLRLGFLGLFLLRCFADGLQAPRWIQHRHNLRIVQNRPRKPSTLLPSHSTRDRKDDLPDLARRRPTLSLEVLRQLHLGVQLSPEPIRNSVVELGAQSLLSGRERDLGQDV